MSNTLWYARHYLLATGIVTAWQELLSSKPAYMNNQLNQDTLAKDVSLVPSFLLDHSLDHPRAVNGLG